MLDAFFLRNDASRIMVRAQYACPELQVEQNWSGQIKVDWVTMSIVEGRDRDDPAMTSAQKRVEYELPKGN
jgi:hypothetical protein